MNPRIRVTLNKGRKGVLLGKLAIISEETTKFLASLGNDLGTAGRNQWTADNFKDGSLGFDLEDPSIPESEADQWRRGFKVIMTDDSTDAEMNQRIQRTTRKQFVSIQKALSLNESIEFGVYSNGDVSPAEIYQFTSQAEPPIEERPRTLSYHGEIQGVVHSFYKEAKPQYLKIRQLCTDDLITCYFSAAMYRSAIETMEAENTVLFVEGEITECLETGQIESINVSDFHFAPDFDLQFHLSFVGSRPDLTDGLSSDEIVRNLRDAE